MGFKGKNKHILLVMLIALFLIVVGCSNDSKKTDGESDSNNQANQSETDNTNDDATNDEEEEEELEPVTLLMMTHWDDGQFETRIKEHVEAAYPHITLEHVRSKADEIEENVFAKGLKPDIIMTSVTHEYLDIELLLDLNPLIEKFDYDLDRLDPAILNYLKAMSNEGELNGLPYIRPEYALVYNPDIFDLFGVEYPTDGMTWDEVIELGKKVTGERNGKHYRGFHPGIPELFDFMFQQIEDGILVDPETDEPIIDQSEPFKKYLETLEKVYSIPGNEMASEEGDERAVNLMRNGDLAMAADRAFAGSYVGKSVETGLNFDFVTYPVWGGEYGEYGPNEPGNGLAVTTTTEHPDDAFRAVMALLSDEHQAWQAAQGNLPAITKQEVKDAFMKDHEHYDLLKDKNLSAITNVEAAPLPIRSRYEKEILEGTGYREALFNKTDINTIIREMQEKAEGNAKNITSKN